ADQQRLSFPLSRAEACAPGCAEGLVVLKAADPAPCATFEQISPEFRRVFRFADRAATPREPMPPHRNDALLRTWDQPSGQARVCALVPHLRDAAVECVVRADSP